MDELVSCTAWGTWDIAWKCTSIHESQCLATANIKEW